MKSHHTTNARNFKSMETNDVKNVHIIHEPGSFHQLPFSKSNSNHWQA